MNATYNVLAAVTPNIMTGSKAAKAGLIALKTVRLMTAGSASRMLTESWSTIQKRMNFDIVPDHILQQTRAVVQVAPPPVVARDDHDTISSDHAYAPFNPAGGVLGQSSEQHTHTTSNVEGHASSMSLQSGVSSLPNPIDADDDIPPSNLDLLKQAKSVQIMSISDIGYKVALDGAAESIEIAQDLLQEECSRESQKKAIDVGTTFQRDSIEKKFLHVGKKPLPQVPLAEERPSKRKRSI